MEEEKRETQREIQILDPGVDPKDTLEPDGACCWGSFLALLG